MFLEEREKTDLQRNALVSVFIRVLEYYEGILILTSNRGMYWRLPRMFFFTIWSQYLNHEINAAIVGIFDEAFKSRVQLALHYPPLDENNSLL